MLQGSLLLKSNAATLVVTLTCNDSDGYKLITHQNIISSIKYIRILVFYIASWLFSMLMRWGGKLHILIISFSYYIFHYGTFYGPRAQCSYFCLYLLLIRSCIHAWFHVLHRCKLYCTVTYVYCVVFSGAVLFRRRDVHNNTCIYRVYFIFPQ